MKSGLTRLSSRTQSILPVSISLRAVGDLPAKGLLNLLIADKRHSAAIYLSTEATDSLFEFDDSHRAAAMPKITWLALLCAPLLGALFILTTIIKAGVPPDNTASAESVETTSKRDGGAPIAKADRLPLNEPAMPTIDLDKRNFATIEVETPPPRAISLAPPLPSTAAPGSPQPSTRRHAAKPPAIRKRFRPEQVQRVPPQGGRIEDPNDVTSWHWHAGSEVIKRARSSALLR